jgi:hypothetical protein
MVILAYAVKILIHSVQEIPQQTEGVGAGAHLEMQAGVEINIMLVAAGVVIGAQGDRGETLSILPP